MIKRTLHLYAYVDKTMRMTNPAGPSVRINFFLIPFLADFVSRNAIPRKTEFEFETEFKSSFAAWLSR